MLVTVKKYNHFLRFGMLGFAFLTFIITLIVPDKTEASTTYPAGHFSEDNLKAIIKDSLDKQTVLIIAPGHELVVKNCLRCHSPQLITAKRASREGWHATINWMQQTQGLPDLGKDEPIILDYLTKNYAPTYEGRRPRLKNIEWYKLEK